MALVIDIIEGFTIFSKTDGKFDGIISPTITGDDEAYTGDDIILTASGSVSAFGTAIEYTWILPDGSTFTEATLNFHIPEDTDPHSIIQIQCFAKDTFDNESYRTLKSITAYDINMPVINGVAWNNSDHFENESYVMTIDATDPNGLDLTYVVVCDDSSVIIVQRGEGDEHIFDITYGEYANVTNITYTITVTNTNLLYNIKSESIDVHYEQKAPIINSVTWNDSDHWENNAYVLTIEATDLNNLDLLYEVVCSDETVDIFQQLSPNEHIFDIVYGEYIDDNNLTFTISVINTDLLFDTKDELIVIHNIDPVISNVYWDNSNHFENESYVMTIIATNSQGLELTYEVVCDDISVGIVQRSGIEEHIFDVTYGEYVGDADLTYTITVTNSAADSTTKNKLIIVHDANPVINSVAWNDSDHWENISYEMTIGASDPNGLDLTYGVICNDGNVGIAQQGTTNIFDITYGEYVGDANLTYTITVTNVDLLTDVETESITVQNISISRGVFGGGYGIPGNVDVIEYVTISTPGNVIDFGNLSDIRRLLTATSNGINDRGVFGGGTVEDETKYSDRLEYINIPTTGNITDFGDLSLGIQALAATSNGTNERGIFAGGYALGVAFLTNIEYITISITGDAIDFGDLSYARYQIASTSNGTNERGIFAGGYGSSDRTNVIEYVTISTTGNTSDFGDLSEIKRSASAISNGTNERGIIGGGYGQAGTVDTIEYVTISTTGNTSDFGDLSTTRREFAGTSNGTNERGIFGGGKDTDNIYTTIIEYITISSIGNTTEFGNLSSIRNNLSATANA